MCFVLLACALLCFFSVVSIPHKKITLTFFPCSSLEHCRRCCILALHSHNVIFLPSLSLSLSSHVFCLSVKLVNSISVYYSLWLFEENETAGTSEQLFQALCISWTEYSISFQFDAYFGDYL